MNDSRTVQSSPKITKAEKSEKIKDPKKVEAGKRLAAISRKAKERKAKERTVVEKVETEDCCTSIDYKYSIRGVGVVAAVGGLSFAYKRDRREASAVKLEKSKRSEQPELNEHNVCVVKHENAVNKKLDSFD